jgi:MOSC domain-containing protein YiiM
MQLVSVNVGKAQPIAAKSGSSGIYKQPSTAPVQVSALGLAQDAIVDVDNHGGVDQAVYLYSTEDYAWWSETLSETLEPGIFGENLTVSGFESATLSVGDRFIIGDVELEVTAPRLPCITLATRMGDPLFVKKFMQAQRPGVYCRVLREGSVQAGEAVRFLATEAASVSILEIFNFSARNASVADLERYLQAPVAVRARTYFTGLQAEMRASGNAAD